MQSERFNNPPLNPAKYGSQGGDYVRTNFYRLESIVDAFDLFVPDWFTDKHGEGRRDSTRLAFEATNTLRRLATERNELKEQVANLKARVAELQDNLKFEAARAQTRAQTPVDLEKAFINDSGPNYELDRKEKFGDPAQYAIRWGRIVTTLDEVAPGWRGPNSAYPNLLGDAAVAAVRKAYRKTEPAQTPTVLPTGILRYAALDVGLGKASAIHSDAPRVSNGVTTYPQWERSYTKQVVDALLNAQWRVANGGLESSIVNKAVRDAAELLRDYHATQHEVYEGRDKARARVKELEVQLSSAQQSLETNRRVNVLIRQQRDGAHKRVMQLTETLNAWRDFGANYETSLQRVGKLLKAS